MEFKNVNEVLLYLQQINYGWLDSEKNSHNQLDKSFKKQYILAKPEEVINFKIGTCFDQVELERQIFKSLGLKFNSYFMIYYDSKKIYTHTFIVYEENDKFYWFENAWENYRGIHEYLSLYDLLTSIKEYFLHFNNIKCFDNDYLCIYKYKKPKFHITLKELYRHYENGENILI